MKKLFENVKFGAHPICWCNDDMLDLGDEYSFEDIVDQAAEAGFVGIELGRKFPKNPEVMKTELGKRGLVLTSGWCDTMFGCPELRDEYMELFQQKARFLKDCGCEVVVAAEGTGSNCWDPREYRAKKGVQKLDDAGWKLFTEGLNEAGAFVKSLGMKLVYHVHTGTCCETYDETKRLCDNTDPELVYLLADTGHLHYCDVDLEKFFTDFADRIAYVHLKNIRELVLDVVRDYKIDFNSSVKCGIFTVPGDGGMDYRPIMQILSDKGYEGWMMVEAEQYLPSPKTLHFMKMAREYLREITGV
ncbi:myo-inosose-2 dehydratase [Butyricicoccus faecihominis]|uniref:myo-inosose-2 dehydratase n=1 Tax=Butyricicoccus faecihominis TaxID=1712515 RepID=UPI0024797BEA|nr:myo-inosose-2 dehydratase [Butyricicoccus faecihominis]